MRKKILLTILAIISLLAATSLAFARIQLDSNFRSDYSPAPTSLNVSAGNGSEFLVWLLQTIAGAILTIAAPVAVIIIAISGFMYTTSHGETAMMDKAKKNLQRAIIGLLIVIFSWVIIKTAITLVIETNPATTDTSKNTTQSAPSDAATSPPPATGPSASAGTNSQVSTPTPPAPGKQ